MATPTYDLLASVTISVAAPVTVTGISQDYRDIIVVHNSGYTGASRVNNDATANAYYNVWMVGNGSTTNSSTYTGQSFANLYIAGSYGAYIAQFLDYSSTDKHKTVLFRVGEGTRVTAWAGRWANTSAINEINFTSNLSAGTTLQIYGIKA